MKCSARVITVNYEIVKSSVNNNHVLVLDVAEKAAKESGKNLSFS